MRKVATSIEKRYGFSTVHPVNNMADSSPCKLFSFWKLGHIATIFSSAKVGILTRERNFKRCKYPCLYYSNSSATFHCVLEGDKSTILPRCSRRRQVPLSALLSTTTKDNNYYSSIPVRITTRISRDVSNFSTRNVENLVFIPPVCVPNTHYCSPRVRFGLWNARSIRNKTTTLCEFVVSNQLNIMVLTETWLKGDDSDARTIADISNTLCGHKFVHLPRKYKNGGGVAVILRNGFGIKMNDYIEYTAMECLDITVKAGNKSLRLVSIYRPPSSTKNNLTTSVFFNDFSRLIEDLSTSQACCLISGDFNFHMDACNPEAKLFRNF